MNDRVKENENAGFKEYSFEYIFVCRSSEAIWVSDSLKSYEKNAHKNT